MCKNRSCKYRYRSYLSDHRVKQLDSDSHSDGIAATETSTRVGPSPVSLLPDDPSHFSLITIFKKPRRCTHYAKGFVEISHHLSYVGFYWTRRIAETDMSIVAL